MDGRAGGEDCFAASNWYPSKCFCLLWKMVLQLSSPLHSKPTPPPATHPTLFGLSLSRSSGLLPLQWIMPRNPFLTPRASLLVSKYSDSTWSQPRLPGFPLTLHTWPSFPCCHRNPASVYCSTPLILYPFLLLCPSWLSIKTNRSEWAISCELLLQLLGGNERKSKSPPERQRLLSNWVGKRTTEFGKAMLYRILEYKLLKIWLKAIALGGLQMWHFWIKIKNNNNDKR